MTCPVCGAVTGAGARFCSQCGTALAAGGPGEAVERRLVTVLFGDLSDFTAWAEDLDPERVGLVTDRVLAALTAAVTEVGGHVDKLTGDGIMAVFGAPTAHEDDPERAVRAAWQMQRSVRRLVEAEHGGGRQLGLRVGLNTGQVLAGVQAALAYTVVGDTVNTASRLSDAAGVGQVLAGRDTAAATMSMATWRVLAPVRLKGKRDPVAAYELAELRSAVGRLGGEETPTIGRDAELGLLVGRLRDVVATGAPGVVVLTGDAGVGKTRLAEELTRATAGVVAARTLWGRATRFGEGRDLAPLAELVRTACGIADTDAPAEALHRLHRTVERLTHPGHGGFVPERLADQLAALLGLARDGEPPRSTATPGPRPGGLPGEVEGALRLLTGLAVQTPLVLVVDDLSAAAWVTVRMVAELCRRLTGPVLVLLAGRPDLLEALGECVQWLPGAELVPLAPLEPAAAERLLRAYLGGAQLAPEVRRLVLERAQGNPFFLAELLHLLVDRGLLRQQDSSWVLIAEPPPDLLPAGVQAVLAARIDSLQPATKAVLRDAAVLGERASAAALAAMGHTDPAALAVALGQLVDRGILRTDGEDGFTFRHTLVRDVAYAGLAKAERAHRHLLAAQWAATGLAGSREDVDTVVAAQAERALGLAQEMTLPAADPAWAAGELAFAAATRLGQAALARDDNRGAAAQLDRALRLGGPDAAPPAALAARLAYAEALAGLRRLEDAEAELAAPLRSGEPALRAGGLVVLGDVRRKQGALEAARTAWVSALAAAADAGLDRLAGQAVRSLGLLDYFTGRFGAAEARFTEALTLARRVGDQRGAGWALQHLAWSATTRGQWDLADAALAEAGEVFGALDDGDGLSWCAGTEAFIRVLEGRLHEARSMVAGLTALAESMDQRWEVAACLTIDALAAGELGQLSLADREAVRAVEFFHASADPWGVGLALCARGLCARGRGDTAAAVGHLEQARELADAGGHRAVTLLALTVQGLTYLDAGELAAATKVSAALQDQLGELELGPGARLGPQVLHAQVLRAAGEREQAVAVLEAVLADFTGRSLLFPYRQALAHLAGTLLELGRPGEGLRRALAAQDAPGEDIRSRVVALRALAAGRVATGDPAAARAALAQARDLAYGSEQTSERAATDRVLAALG